MDLVERGADAEALGNLLADCGAGRGSLAVVSGAVASGKTALLHTFAEEAARAGAVTLRATASRTERDLPLEVIGQLVTGADMAEADRRRFVQSLDAWTAQAQKQATGQPRSHMLMLRDLGRVLLHPAERRSALIIVDDVHHADAASLECLLYLVRRLRSTRVLMVLSECGSYRQEYSRFRAEVLQLPYCRQLRLKPLSLRGVAEMLTQDLGAAVARVLTAACHRLSGGSPMLVRALLEDRRATAHAEASDLVPGTVYGQAVLTSIYRCEPMAQEVAKAVAVLGEYASAAVLEEVLGASPEAIASALNALNAARLLAAGRFRHEAARAAVAQSLDGCLRGVLNGRAARILHARGAPPAVVTRHLIAAREVEPDWAVPVLCDAATQALADDDVDLAMCCLQAAHAMCKDKEQSLAITAALLRAEWRAGSSAADRHLPTLSAAARERRLNEPDATALLGYLLWNGRVDQAIEVLGALAPPAEGTPALDVPGSAKTDSARTWLGIAYPGLADWPRHATVPPLYDGLVSVPRMSRRSAALLAGVLTQGRDGDQLGDAEAVLQGCQLQTDSLAAIVGALTSLIITNKLDRAAFWCEAMRADASGRQAPMWEALLAAISASIDLRLGRPASAEESARAALTLASPRSWGVALCLPLASMLLARIASGAFHEAAACLRMTVPDEAFQTIGALYYLHARGRYHLATDHPHAAVNDFESCRDLAVAWGVDVPTLVSWRTDLAEGWLRLGKVAEARELVHGELARLRPEDARARGIALRVLALCSDLCRRGPLLSQSADALEESGDLLELAATFAELGHAYWALGDERQGRTMARQAQRLAQGCGARLPAGAPASHAADSAADSPVPDGAGVTLVAELSGAELRVAELAAQGHTNRQIAAKLFITVSTVEQHLTRVYRKLQLRRRADLPVVLQWRIPAFDFGHGTTGSTQTKTSSRVSHVCRKGYSADLS